MLLFSMDRASDLNDCLLDVFSSLQSDEKFDHNSGNGQNHDFGSSIRLSCRH